MVTSLYGGICSSKVCVPPPTHTQFAVSRKESHIIPEVGTHVCEIIGTCKCVTTEVESTLLHPGIKAYWQLHVVCFQLAFDIAQTCLLAITCSVLSTSV